MARDLLDGRLAGFVISDVPTKVPCLARATAQCAPSVEEVEGEVFFTVLLDLLWMSTFHRPLKSFSQRDIIGISLDEDSFIGFPSMSFPRCCWSEPFRRSCARLNQWIRERCG